MKKSIRALSALLAVLVLAGCMSLSAFAAEDYSNGSPWLDPEILGNVTEETVADLKDNFALAANREAYIYTEIPEGYPYGGTVMNRSLELSGEMIELFETADPSTSHDAEMSLNLYHLLLDWEGRDALGMSPVLELLEPVENLDSMEALDAYFTETDPLDIAGGLVGAMADTDLADASARTLYITGSGLLLGDPAYYLEESELGTLTREATAEYVLKLLEKAGYTEEEAAGLLEACFDFETLLAEVSYTVEESNSPDYIYRIYNPMTVEEAAAICAPYPLEADLANVGFDAEYCIVMNPAALARVGELYREEYLDAIKAYIIVNAIASSATTLDRECYLWAMEYNNTMSGTVGMVSDEVYASSTAASLMGWPVAHMYCDTYVTEEEKAELNDVIREIVDAYRVMLSEETFISEETRDYAVEKLDNLYIRCMYPDDWTPYDFSSVSFAGPEDGGTLYEALRAISARAIEENIRELNEPVERSEWADGILPTVLNCFYNPMDNSVNILAAFAGGDLYNGDMSPEQVYATMGTVIGHEISHAFDSSGAQYDKDGNYASWWTEEDYAAFTAMNMNIAEYFNGITAWEGQGILGSTLTGEACADMGGMACVLRIAAEKEDFDYDAFFRAYAALWINVETPLMSMTRIMQDTHPLCYLRINTVLQQFDEFLDFYGITEGDGMYLATADRIRVW